MCHLSFASLFFVWLTSVWCDGLVGRAGGGRAGGERTEMSVLRLAQFRAHVNGLVRQLLALQDSGMTIAELLTSMPPCVITFDDEAASETQTGQQVVKWTDKDGVARERRVGLWWEGSTHDWREARLQGAHMREIIATNVETFPYLNLTLDGGT